MKIVDFLKQTFETQTEEISAVLDEAGNEIEPARTEETQIETTVIPDGWYRHDDGVCPDGFIKIANFEEEA